MNKVFIIVGPTGSGKSALATDHAIKNNGIIINSDAFQVYKEISICTSCPSSKDKASLEHLLYNYTSAYEDYSVANWLDDVKKLINYAISKNKLPILVGGSAMYIYLLINGIDDTPKVSSEIKDVAKKNFENLGAEKIYSTLLEIDPKIETKINRNDTQRIMRFYEVYLATGKNLWDFYENNSDKIQNNNGIKNSYEIEMHKILPEREILYEKCDKRILEFMKNGAMDEARSLYTETHKLNKSAKKIILLRELFDYLDGKISLDDAISLAQKNTRNYAKRQYTWFRNKF